MHLEEKRPCRCTAHDDLEENGTRTKSITISVRELCLYQKLFSCYCYYDAETNEKCNF